MSGIAVVRVRNGYLAIGIFIHSLGSYLLCLVCVCACVRTCVCVHVCYIHHLCTYLCPSHLMMCSQTVQGASRESPTILDMVRAYSLHNYIYTLMFVYIQLYNCGVYVIRMCCVYQASAHSFMLL